MTLTFNLFMDLCNYHAPLHYISWLCDKILLEEEELTSHLLFLKSYFIIHPYLPHSMPRG